MKWKKRFHEASPDKGESQRRALRLRRESRLSSVDTGESIGRKIKRGHVRCVVFDHIGQGFIAIEGSLDGSVALRLFSPNNAFSSSDGALFYKGLRFTDKSCFW